jgi:hypothetical protein
LIAVVTATGIEAAAARKALPPDVKVIEAGIALAAVRAHYDDLAISCGVAGGLRDDLPTGTVLIPASVRCADGSIFECDASASQALRRAAVAVGYMPVEAPLITTATLVYGANRRTLAAAGYAGVDMETGLIDAPRIACVRVVLDTPQREISPVWEKPWRVPLHPRAWRDLPFLAREGPRCARIAAQIIAAAVPALRAARSSEVR